MMQTLCGKVYKEVEDFGTWIVDVGSVEGSTVSCSFASTSCEFCVVEKSRMDQSL